MSLLAALVGVATTPSLQIRTSHASIPNAMGAQEQSPPVLPAAAPPRSLDITYRADDGRPRNAVVLLPHGYRGDSPQPLPLVISPHGGGLDGAINARLWGNLPTIGRFAVVNPDGEGRRLARRSWGAPGQIRDLARMPAIVAAALPWVRIDRTRIYAVGGSMGGQETLLLLARYPRLLAGAVAVDSVVDFARQYRNFPKLRCDGRCRRLWGNLGLGRQLLARREVGGTPSTALAAYAERSALTSAGAIASSCVPLQIWWSRYDDVVMQPQLQSGALFRAIVHSNPHAAVDEYVGRWMHTKALNARTRLPMMLAGLGLLPSVYSYDWPGLEHNGVSVGRCTGR
jgi:pimeloyl-ACP methyl ester carboxylesterase